MSEMAEKYKEKHEPFSGSNILFTFVYLVELQILHEFFKLPFTLALALAFGVAKLIDYWVPPKPPVSLPTWLLRVLGVTLILLASFWLVPKILSQLMWQPIAYALPCFILFFSMFFTPSLYEEKFWTLKLPATEEPENTKKRKIVLVKLALISFVVAALFGVALSYLDET